MREILFRGKGNKKYNDGDWYYGVPIQCDDGDWQICTNCSKRTVVAETIGEYTGLTDKNGTRIFEGDIVLLRDDEEPYQVAFDECCFQVFDSGVCYNMDCFRSEDIEIIGTIYDNPELLRSDTE